MTPRASNKNSHSQPLTHAKRQPSTYVGFVTEQFCERNATYPSVPAITRRLSRAWLRNLRDCNRVAADMTAFQYSNPSVQYGKLACAILHKRRWQGPSKSKARLCSPLHDRAVLSGGPVKGCGRARLPSSLPRARDAQCVQRRTRYQASANRLRGQSQPSLLRFPNGSDAS